MRPRALLAWPISRSRPSSRSWPTWKAWTVVVLSALVVSLSTAPTPAVAESDGYRYWSFWVGDDQGEWSYASQGPTTLRPADGKVVGFRFAQSDSAGAPASLDSDSQPRDAADFEAVCSDTEDSSDGKRVAVVIDPGTGRDAPAGERPPKAKTICAQLPDDGSAADALAKDAPPLRYNSSGLLCAIAGYPSSGCGERTSGNDGDADGDGDGDADGTDASDPSDDDTDDSGGAALPLVAGLGVVTCVVAGAVWQTRRRRDS